ncbi:glutathione S-transferase family protein [Dyella caseinilytica]|uniref:Glutathione S-transferase n=1 Tax=Dyella caseinilytica TaxID=1849581 RepID=A0ABX7GVB9_9GAMM|nr:glutathione S-transferase [Dyella caseinilytica]QRN53814.1 glutathione S-transferase [Dyella caseinilytica]GFZ89377.1 glutathione S-transferase [Dyella caseinilytica]
MKLFYQTHSPYARKVLVMAHEVGLADRLQVIHYETSPTARNEDVFGVNPLGKVPVLIPDNGPVLFDSNVICEYLDGLHARQRAIPSDIGERMLSLRLQALAQGLCDAGILLRHETERRPEPYRYPAMRDGQAQKLVSAYDFLEHQEPAIDPDNANAPHVDIGQIALATALSWLAFRNMPAFEPRRPRLSEWYRRFLQRPSMLATPLAGETVD